MATLGDKLNAINTNMENARLAKKRKDKQTLEDAIQIIVDKIMFSLKMNPTNWVELKFRFDMLENLQSECNNESYTSNIMERFNTCMVNENVHMTSLRIGFETNFQYDLFEKNRFRINAHVKSTAPNVVVDGQAVDNIVVDGLPYDETNDVKFPLDVTKDMKEPVDNLPPHVKFPIDVTNDRKVPHIGNMHPTKKTCSCIIS